MTDPIDLPPVATGAATPRTTPRALTQVRCDLSWQGTEAHHTDALVLPRLDLWRDLLPPPLDALIQDQPVGARVVHRFAPGTLVEPFQPGRLLRLRPDQFNGQVRGGGSILPRAGRFYPRGMLTGVPGVVAADRNPCRVINVADDRIGIDLNHPLAEQTLELAIGIEAIGQPADQRGGRCNDVAGLVTGGGPGMQQRWRGQPSDLGSADAFARADPRPDAEFYAAPRLVDHLDRTAIAGIGALYRGLIPDQARVLDLMASWHSHLPAGLEAVSVIGLGMNQAELDANPVLDRRLVQDLNADPTLPLADASLDAVICTASVEYLIAPQRVFREVARVLAPGGRFIVSFSNRWFPSKAIRVWSELHEFERLALVLEWFLDAGGFTDLSTFSLRGRPRPADDRYAGQFALSDPVYAVWGTRAA